MKVFISHTHQGEALAQKIADGLKNEGLQVWLPENEILPGDNWAEKISEALNHSQAMVALLTPDALHSGSVLQEVSFALGKKDYRQRLIPVLVGSADELPLDAIPWILRRFQTIRLVGAKAVDETVKQISHALLVAT